MVTKKKEECETYNKVILFVKIFTFRSSYSFTTGRAMGR